MTWHGHCINARSMTQTNTKTTKTTGKQRMIETLKTSFGFARLDAIGVYNYSGVTVTDTEVLSMCFSPVADKPIGSTYKHKGVGASWFAVPTIEAWDRWMTFSQEQQKAILTELKDDKTATFDFATFTVTRPQAKKAATKTKTTETPTAVMTRTDFCAELDRRFNALKTELKADQEAQTKTILAAFTERRNGLVNEIIIPNAPTPPNTLSSSNSHPGY